MATKPTKKPVKGAKLSVNMRKGKTISMSVVKPVDKSSPTLAIHC